MKLLQYTSRYFLAMILSLLVLLSAALYVSIRFTVYKDIDEYLINRRIEILNVIDEHPDIIQEKSMYHDDVFINPISEKEYKKFLSKHEDGKFKDTRKYDTTEQEHEPFRKLESVFEKNKNHYKLTITASLLNPQELLYTIFFNIILLSALLILLTVVLNRILLGRIWKPFKKNIEQIVQYRLDKDIKQKFVKSNITEFNELNDSLEKLISNNLKVYENQKQFIENASHEMQTPLGVMQNKIDLLMETYSLSDAQAGMVDALAEQVNRLSRLNTTLLLLSKIENNQYSKNESINPSKLIEKCCDDFSELIEFKSIQLEINKDSSVELEMHPDLARMLFSNLIKNAINHNVVCGFITIYIQHHMISITNSGKELLISPELLFERFSKKSDNPQSTGLGLAIVKSICDFYNFRISYLYKDNVHTLTINF